MPLEQGFREVDHTADWELEVWAPDLLALLAESAKGMFHLAGMQVYPSPESNVEFTICTSDPERLLVSFLNELLFRAENTRHGFTDFDLRMVDDCLHAQITSYPLKSFDKEIKAVTYHFLKIRREKNGYRTRIVFDV